MKPRMIEDKEVDTKARELAEKLRAALVSIGVTVEASRALRVIESFASLQPPEHDTRMYWLRMHLGGRGGGYSVKPGNITLNMQKLVTALAGGVLTAAGIAAAPWSAVFGALVIWDSLYSAARVDLSEEDASVMWTLWRRRDAEHTVPHDGLLASVNEERARHGRHALSEQQLADAVAKLRRIDAIEQSSQDPSRWWLREWVRVDWS